IKKYILNYDIKKEKKETEMKKNEQKVELLNKEIKNLNKKLNEINENIEKINNKEEDNLTNQAKLNKQLHQLEINLAESEERLKYQKERHTSIENEYQSLIEKEKELKLKLNDLDE